MRAAVARWQSATAPTSATAGPSARSNLTTELPALLPDVGELPWAAEAFGSAPDAVNLWIGDERAATTFHKARRGAGAGLHRPPPPHPPAPWVQRPAGSLRCAASQA